MSQRKKKSTGQDRQLKRQRAFNRLLLVGALVAIAVITAYAFTRQNLVPLPPYLDRCIPLSGSLVYSSTPQLRIVTNGQNRTIPARIGIVGPCVRPLHTFTASGTIHIDTDEDRNYTLGDFFTVWGNSIGPEFGTFNRNQIFNLRTDSTHTITMMVNNQTDTSDFQNLVFPRHANTTANPFRILITYG